MKRRRSPGRALLSVGRSAAFVSSVTVLAGHGFHLAPDAVEVLQVIGGVADGDVVDRGAVARGAAEKAVRALPLAGAGSRAEVAVLPQMRAIAAALARAAFGHIDAHAVQGDVRRVFEHDGSRGGVEAGKAVAHAQHAEFAIRALPVRIVDALHQIRVAHVDPVAAIGGGRDVLVAQLADAGLQIVERHAEAAVALEGKQPLLVAALVSSRAPRRRARAGSQSDCPRGRCA